MTDETSKMEDNSVSSEVPPEALPQENASEPVVDTTDDIPPLTEDVKRLIEKLLTTVQRDEFTATIISDTLDRMQAKGEEVFNKEISAQIIRVLQDGDPTPTMLGALIAILNKSTVGGYERSAEHSKEADRGDDIGSSKVLADGTKIGSGVPKTMAVADASDAASVTMAYKAKRKKVRRVPLPNSGFNVTIEAPTISRLYEFQMAVRDGDNDWGRLIGHHHYYFSAHVVKAELMKLFIDQVRDSNLKDWNKDKTLLQSISFNDYEICCWALATLLYPEGYTHEITCTEPGCFYTKSFELDLTKTLRMNFTRMGENALRFLQRNSVTRGDLAEYRQMLNADGSQTTSVMHDGAQWHIRVPMMSEYLEAARKYTTNIISNIYIKGPANITEAMKYSYLRRFSPWISSIVDSDGTVYNTPDGISGICDAVSSEPIIDPKTAWWKPIEQFILASSVAQIAIPTSKCPKCGHVIGGSNSYTVLDIQRNFFTMVDHVRTQLLSA